MSALVLVLTGLILILPEKNRDMAIKAYQDEGGTIFGDDPDALGGFGLLDLEEETEGGFGMIGAKPGTTQGFGQICIGSSESDSEFSSRISNDLGVDPLRVSSKSGFLFAELEDFSLYMENNGMSNVKGFNGPIDLALVMGNDGKMDSLIYKGSSETPFYLRKMSTAGYFTQYTGLELDRSHTLDAVSGATISSVAVARAVNELYWASFEAFPSRGTGSFLVEAKLSRIWILNLALLVIMFLAMSLRKFRRKPVILIVSLVSLAWLGFYLNSSFTFLLFIQAFASRGLSVFTIAYIGLVLVSAIWFRNSYCKHVCPYGNAQRLVQKISPFPKKQFFLTNRQLRLIRYAVAVFIIAGYLAGLDILSRYELFPHLFGEELSSVMFWVSLGMVLISLRVPNLWCRALCPTGCVLDTVSDLAEKRFKSDSYKSIHKTI